MEDYSERHPMIIPINTNSLARFVRSGFGVRRMWRTIRNYRGRAQVVAKVHAGQSMVTRREVSLLLGSPVLLVDAEVVALQKYGQRAHSAIVEIGAAYGGSSLLFLLSKKEYTKVYSIDPFVVDSMDTFQATRELCYNHVVCALADVGKAERSSSWTLIPEYSYDRVKKWESAINVLFIDGDHTYDAVKQDFEQWLPFVHSEGYILFHDSNILPNTPDGKYNRGWPGPSRFVIELEKYPSVRMVEKIHSITVFQKK